MSPRSRWFRPFLGAFTGAALVALTAASAFAQGIGTVRGVVTDAVGNRPLNGVQVFVPGTDLGTVSNENGQFELNLAAGRYSVTVRRVGYTTTSQAATVAAGQVVELNFQMQQTVVLLDEVVVTGAGAATEKKRLGNTIASIKATELEDAPTINFSELISGREAGVVVQPSGGLAGEGARIRIRGSASLSQSNEPIVYIDGIRIDNGGGFGTFFFVGGGGSPSRLDDINPDAIERVEILKGAAAATLYGTEASNGVIQIFTKKGSRGAPQFDFQVEQGFSGGNLDRIKKNTGFARQDAVQTADGFLTAAELSSFWGASPHCRKLSGGACTGLQPFEVFEVDYFDELFDLGYTQTYTGSVSGGTSGVTYFVSTRFNTDDGPFTTESIGGLANDFNRKVQATANMELLPNDKLRFRISTQFADVHHETPQNNNNIFGVIPSAMDAKPERATCVTTFGAGTANGNGTCDPVGNPEGATFATTRETAQSTVEQEARHWVGSFQAQYQPISELSIDATFGVDVTTQKSSEFFPFAWNVDLLSSSGVQGCRATDARNRREITLETKAQWDRRFGDNITSTFVAGGQGFIARTVRDFAFGDAFPGPGLEVVSATADQVAGESFLEVVNAGAFAQEQLGFSEFVYVTGGFRYDRNSAFGENTEGTFYPKASVSIVPSDLPGWNSNLVSTFRVRGAWGKSGLQPGAFDKFTTFSAAASALGPALVADNLGNQDLEPEKSTEIEVGAEFGLFNNRLALDVTYWDRETQDALFARQFAPSGGFVNQQIVNIGQLDAKGFEIAANALVINKADLTVRMHANASWLDEVVTSLGGAPPIKIGGAYIRYRNWLKEGFAPGALFGASLENVPAGQFAVDTNNDGQPDTEAELLAYLAGPLAAGFSDAGIRRLLLDNALDTPLGKPTPDWQGSFGTNIGIKGNLEISTLFEFKAGDFFVHNLTDSFRATHPAIGRNFAQATEAEAVIMNPASTAQERLEAFRVFSEELKHLAPFSGLNAVRPADFLRWRELALTYRLPRSFAQNKLGLRYVTLNASIRNLALWTEYDGVDPESNLVSRGGDPGSGGAATVDNNFGDGIDAWAPPIPRRFTFSVRFGF